MCAEMVPGRVRRNNEWLDEKVPRCVADIVSALNRGHCDVAGATCDSITLADGRVLCVRRGWRYPAAADLATGKQEK